MKRMASAKKTSSASGTSTKAKAAATQRRFAVCVRNDGYEASLERNKIYAVVADDDAERDGDLRVVDESGEGYLFPKAGKGPPFDIHFNRILVFPTSRSSRFEA